MTKVIVEQPLALPGPAKKRELKLKTYTQQINSEKSEESSNKKKEKN